MSRRFRIMALGSVLAIVLLVLAIATQSGNAIAAAAADTGGRNRQYLVAFVGLILFAVIAMGGDLRDWL